jgi:hypothetical protein
MFKEKAMRGLICLLAIMLVSKGWAVAEEAIQGTETVEAQTIEPKLIVEYKFDESVVDVIFGEAEMTVKEARKRGMKGLEKRKAMEIVKVQYPKVVVLGKRVKYTEDYEELHETSINFFDKNGKKKKEIFLQQSLPDRDYGRAMVGISKNRKYLAIYTPVVTTPIELRGKITDWEESGYIKNDTVIMDTEGNKLWSVVLECSGNPHISSNGKYIVDIDVGGELDGPSVIYNENGMVKEIWALGCFAVDFSKDGSWFAVITERRHDLIVFDEKGNELWKKRNFGEGWDSEKCLNISEDDIITIIFGMNQDIKYRFDKKGNLIEPKPKEEE